MDGRTPLTSAEADQAPPAAAGDTGAAKPCDTCMSGRAMLGVFAFAALTAFVAADLASGGRLTAYVVGLVASLRAGRADD